MDLAVPYNKARIIQDIHLPFIEPKNGDIITDGLKDFIWYNHNYYEIKNNIIPMVVLKNDNIFDVNYFFNVDNWYGLKPHSFIHFDRIFDFKRNIDINNLTCSIGSITKNIIEIHIVYYFLFNYVWYKFILIDFIDYKTIMNFDKIYELKESLLWEDDENLINKVILKNYDYVKNFLLYLEGKKNDLVQVYDTNSVYDYNIIY